MSQSFLSKKIVRLSASNRKGRFCFRPRWGRVWAAQSCLQSISPNLGSPRYLLPSRGKMAPMEGAVVLILWQAKPLQPFGRSGTLLVMPSKRKITQAKRFTEQDIGCKFHLNKDVYQKWNDRFRLFLPKGTNVLLVALRQDWDEFIVAAEKLAGNRFRFNPDDLERGEFCCKECHRPYSPMSPSLCPL